MKPEDVPMTTFNMRNGCFAFKRMSFGLSGAPFTFQKVMNTIFRTVLGKGVFVYLNYIIVIMATFEEHLRLLREVLPYCAVLV